MNRFSLRATALACAVGLASLLGACNASTSDLSALQGAVTSGALTPTLKPGQLTTGNLQNAGFTPSQISKIQNAVTKAQSVAKAICPFVPLAEGLANVAIASTAGGALQGVTGTVNVVCDALRSAPAYASLGNRKGELVTAYVQVGPFDRVPVYGVRR